MALSTHRASTSRTSAEWAPPHWKHDVFLSFRGEDTRSGFLSHLYHELQYWQAIKTFKDDRDLEIGASISPELLTAIEESHLAIIVLSPNYASSAWCLDELSKILECMQDTERILPIFYHVDPSHVRNQKGSFAEAFAKHEEMFSEDVDKVKRWRDALKEVANLVGWDSKNYQSEAELIKHIVKCVFRKVQPTFVLSGSLDKLVGIDSALEQLHLHLAPEDNDIRFIALTTLGSFLYARGQDKWKSALDNLGKIHNPTIFDSLKLSYDGLEEEEKKVFLHIACFHEGEGEEQVIEILDSIYNISSSIIIDTLIEKSLLIIDKFHNRKSVRVHDLIKEMAWKIVHLESQGDLCQRSRLWLRDDISHVFMHNSEMRALESIVLRLPKLELVDWNCTEAFNEMHGLRLLHFDNVMFSSGPKFLPNSLRIIQWSQYPSKSLPSSFEPHLLSRLEMRESKLVRLSDGAKDFPHLKSMDLRFSHELTSTPDFTRILNLERLNLDDCWKLEEVHPSIAVHKKLKHFTFIGCESLKSLPSELEMDSIESIDIWNCPKLKKIPEFGEHMQNLKSIHIRKTAIEQIPSSIERLVGLKYLYISECKSLLCLPSAICNLKSLEILHAGGFSKVDKLPGEMELDLSGSALRKALVAMKNLKNRTLSVRRGVDRIFGIRKNPDPEPCGLVLSSLNRLGSLTELYMSDCNIGEGAIPDDIGCLSYLKNLDLSGNNFVSLPSSIRLLSELRILGLHRCKRLEQLPDLPPKRSSLFVSVDDCTSLKRLSDPSKLSEGANVYDFKFSCLNCFRLVEEEEVRINRIFAMIMRHPDKVRYSDDRIVWPGSEIPDWFDNQSVGDSIIVEPPLPPQTCSDWVGIALCVVFEDSELLKHPDYRIFRITCSGKRYCFRVGHLRSQHLFVFHLPRKERDVLSSHQLSFEGHYWSLKFEDYEELKTSLIIKKCGARLVYKRDLEEFSRSQQYMDTMTRQGPIDN